jgi:hypothetical protein
MDHQGWRRRLRRLRRDRASPPTIIDPTGPLPANVGERTVEATVSVTGTLSAAGD